MRDQQLRHDVQNALDWEPGVDATGWKDFGILFAGVLCTLLWFLRVESRREAHQ